MYIPIYRSISGGKLLHISQTWQQPDLGIGREDGVNGLRVLLATTCGVDWYECIND